MLYIEDYVIVNKGIKPSNNQDNIFVNGTYLSENNNGLDTYNQKNNFKKNNLIYAVFDGIGGMEKGEYASYICSRVLGNNLERKDVINIINDKIIDINNIENIKMGSTASIVRIKNNKLYISQVGDSPIYILSDGNFIKIIENDSKVNLLENYLGKDKDLRINNQVFNIKNGDKILICSDGLSKEIGDLEIEYILDQSNDSKFISEKLLNYALMNGGNDNISIVTLVIKKSYKNIFYVILIILIIILNIIIFI